MMVEKLDGDEFEHEMENKQREKKKYITLPTV